MRTIKINLLQRQLLRPTRDDHTSCAGRGKIHTQGINIIIIIVIIIVIIIITVIIMIKIMIIIIIIITF